MSCWNLYENSQTSRIGYTRCEHGGFRSFWFHAVKRFGILASHKCAVTLISYFRGYDTKIDFDLLFMFCRIDDVCKPVSFQQTYNFVVRHVITFLESSEYEKHANFFDSLVEKPDVVTMFKWIFNLLIETPDAVEIFTTNPFSYELGVSVKMENIIGRTLLPSYVVQLRIFYKWISNELYLLFTWVPNTDLCWK